MSMNDITNNDKKKFLSISAFEYDVRTLKEDKIKAILSIPSEKRTPGQKTMLVYFCLNVSKLPQKFFKEHIDKASYTNIIFLSESSFTYKLILNKNVPICEVNDIANYFYIILKGSAKIIKPEKYVNEMTTHEYYLLLMKYKKNKEYCLLDKTLKANFNLFPIDKKDIKDLERIYLKLLMIKQDEKFNEDPIEDLINKVGLKMSDFGLMTYQEFNEKNKKNDEEDKLFLSQNETEEIGEITIYNNENEKEREYNKENRNKIKNILSYIKTDVTVYYSFLISEDKFHIIHFKFIDIKEISTNDYFGDFENNKYIYRVMPTSDELDLFLMKNDIYSEFMKNQKKKIKADQINFLIQNFCFTSINKHIFEKIYYNLFDFEHYKINDIIVKENTPVDYIYFIKNGIIHLVSNKSVVENHLMIKMIYDILKKEKRKDSNKTFNKKYMKLYSLSFGDKFEHSNKELNTKKNSNLMIYQDNQCLGHECFFFGLNYLYTAIAKSEEVELYKISVDKLKKIIKDKNNYVFNKFAEKSFESLSLFLKLIININFNLANSYNKNKSEDDIIKKIMKERQLSPDEKDNKNSSNAILKSRNYEKNPPKIFNYNLKRKINMNKKLNLPKYNNNIFEVQFYKALPVLNKSHNFKNISIYKDEKNNKNNDIGDKRREPEISIFKRRNSSLFYQNSFRSFHSSNNISNINQKYNNNSIVNIFNNKQKEKSKIIIENSLLKKLKKNKINSINLFSLRKNIYDNKNKNNKIINNSNNSSNIISFDYSIQQKYKNPSSVSNRDIKYKKRYKISLKNLKKNNTQLNEFNSFYKFYLSLFNSNKTFKNYKYDKKQSMIANITKFKYSLIDELCPKYKFNNDTLNFILISNSEDKEKSNNNLYGKI